jgi:signal transduction histidine kinase/CheY-like chemotaxis protein
MTLQILHLEDNPADAELVRRNLKRAQVDCEVQTVDTPEAYEAAVKKKPYDVILSDSGIPGYDGHAARSYALTHSPTTPFIVVSGGVESTGVHPQASPGFPAAHVSKSQLDLLAGVIQASLRELRPRPPEPVARPRDTKYLISVIQALSLARDLETVMDVVRHAARKLVAADGATFVLRDGDRCFYAQEDAIAPLWKGQRFPMSACISGWVMLNRRAAAIDDIYEDPRIPHDAYRPTFVKSLVMTPIRTAAPIGAIGVYWARPHVASADEIDVLSALADSTCVAMESVDLIANLEQRVASRTEELRRRSLELEVLNRELEAFSYSVAHDLRSPLITIDGFGNLLKEACGENLTEESRGYLSRITQATERAKQLIEDLLSLSKIVRAPMKAAPVQLGPIAAEIAAGLKERYKERHVQFECGDGIANADAGMVRIVLENLLSNAWKFSSKQPHAKVQFGVSSSTSDLTTFFVRDNGAGFDPRYCANLFSPFHRLHTQEQFPGTGIGLATVRRIVNRHGGEIRAEAQVNQGACFYFSLPTLPTL